MNPYNHAQSSVAKWGGTIEDYLPIHELMDSTKGAVASNKHRIFTHNSWFTTIALPLIFGHVIENSDGKEVFVKSIGERHIREDFKGFIPSPQDWTKYLDFRTWMNGMTRYELDNRLTHKTEESVLQTEELS